jgi:undecaprenyl-diphosphatase
MVVSPTRFDLWIAASLATLWGRFPAVDAIISQSVGTRLLGGVWYAAILFVFWLQGAQAGQERIRCRILTIAAGSILAAALTVLAMQAISWPPPSSHPAIARLYPDDFADNLNRNSFPSQSTALYAAVASGIYSLSPPIGRWAWAGIVVLVALPRMYLGGHYLSDVIAGLVAGLAGYWCAALLEPFVIPLWDRVFRQRLTQWQRSLAEAIIFLWLLQIANEFRHVSWIAHALVNIRT